MTVAIYLVARCPTVAKLLNELRFQKFYSALQYYTHLFCLPCHTPSNAMPKSNASVKFIICRVRYPYFPICLTFVEKIHIQETLHRFASRTSQIEVPFHEIIHAILHDGAHNVKLSGQTQFEYSLVEKRIQPRGGFGGKRL